MTFQLRADLTYHFATPSETLLLIEAAHGPDQTVLKEALVIEPPTDMVRRDDRSSGERRVVFTASGRVRIAYEATVVAHRIETPLACAAQSLIRDLPAEALRYLRPSRFCPSDRFERFVQREFGDTAGGARVATILDWIADHVDYEAGVSDSGTTALSTFADRAGVCRDFTHLAIALFRAGDIPARAVSAYAWKLDPPDLHAVAEVFVGGAWRLVDPTGKAPIEGLVRVATGLDAADIAFMSVFGEAELIAQTFEIEGRSTVVASPSQRFGSQA
jgi:transglutaminase-like putative cysteine protease